MLWLEEDVFVGDVVEALVDADEGQNVGDVDIWAQKVLCVVAAIAPMRPPELPPQLRRAASETTASETTTTAGIGATKPRPRPRPLRQRTFRVTIVLMYGPFAGLHYTRQMVLGETFHIKLGYSDEEMRGEDLREVLERHGRATAPADFQGYNYDSDSDSDSDSSGSGSGSASGDSDDEVEFDLGAEALRLITRTARESQGQQQQQQERRRARKRRRTADELAKIESYSDPRIAEMAEMSAGGRKTRSQFYAAA